MKTMIKKTSFFAAACLLLFGTSSLAIAASKGSSQQSAATANEKKSPLSWMFFLQAKQAVMTKSRDGSYSLVVKKADMMRGIAFTDRPNRIVKQISPHQMGKLFAVGGADSFKADPPNATIAASNGEYMIGEVVSRTISGGTIRLLIKSLDVSTAIRFIQDDSIVLKNIAITIDAVADCGPLGTVGGITAGTEF